MQGALVDKALISLSENIPTTMDLSRERLWRLLEKLGNPQDKTPPVIHVAGTNGKGSTIAYLRAIMEASGYKCHVYTSPHLIAFNERIRLAGSFIADEDLADILDEVRDVNNGDPITFFEITTAAAFLAFSRVPADVLLLETGLGGLDDATNVVRQPLMSVISTISRDHTEWLGEDLASITRHKAGIMREGVPCVIGQQIPWAQDEVLPVLRAEATRLNVPLIWNWGVAACDKVMRICEDNNRQDFPLPNLPGHHQCWNAALAIVTLRHQQHFQIPPEAIEKGLQSAEWPGRLERIGRGRVANLLPAGWELWYDGGHNDSGGEVLGQFIEGWADEGPVHVVLGMLQSKDPAVILKPVLPHVDSLSTFSFKNAPFNQTGPSYQAEALAAKLAGSCPAVRAFPSLQEAVAGVVRQSPPGRILVTGTLYAYKDLF